MWLQTSIIDLPAIFTMGTFQTRWCPSTVYVLRSLAWRIACVGRLKWSSQKKQAQQLQHRSMLLLLLLQNFGSNGCIDRRYVIIFGWGIYLKRRHFLQQWVLALTPLSMWQHYQQRPITHTSIGSKIVLSAAVFSMHVKWCSFLYGTPWLKAVPLVFCLRLEVSFLLR